MVFPNASLEGGSFKAKMPGYDNLPVMVQAYQVLDTALFKGDRGPWRHVSLRIARGLTRVLSEEESEEESVVDE